MSKATIVIVEDEVIVAADLENRLRMLGYEVSGTADKGEEAVSLVRSRRPDLVLMDIQLSGQMDGVEAAEQIRRECDLPVIFLTAHSDASTLARAMVSEPFGYILKPYEERELQIAIEMALYKHRVERALRWNEERNQIFSEEFSRLLASDRPQELVDSLCSRVMRFLDAHVFFSYLADDDRKRLHLSACAGVPEKLAGEVEWLEYGQAICGCVAESGRRIVAENIQETSDQRADLVRSLGIKAYACHPLLDKGQIIGTLSFGTRSRSAFSADELEMMKAISEQMAVAMSRSRAEMALRESEERYRTLFSGMTEGFALHEIICDQDGQPCDYRFLDINPAFESLTGLKRDEVLGKTHNQVLPNDEPQVAADLWRCGADWNSCSFRQFFPGPAETLRGLCISTRTWAVRSHIHGHHRSQESTG